jgi:hypothetical protein
VLLAQALNLVRLVCMFIVGVYFPANFDLVHHLVWQVAMIVVAVCIYVTWVDRLAGARLRRSSALGKLCANDGGGGGRFVNS